MWMIGTHEIASHATAATTHTQWISQTSGCQVTGKVSLVGSNSNLWKGLIQCRRNMTVLPWLTDGNWYTLWRRWNCRSRSSSSSWAVQNVGGNGIVHIGNRIGFSLVIIRTSQIVHLTKLGKENGQKLEMEGGSNLLGLGSGRLPGIHINMFLNSKGQSLTRWLLTVGRYQLHLHLILIILRRLLQPHNQLDGTGSILAVPQLYKFAIIAVPSLGHKLRFGQFAYWSGKS
mmetsp:Transcript_7877/g.18985  ORF Transcript_7877/g.18985 Transcript_7877/m.18985 type:complete len:230 (+) Transcript_7877:357-1046(+)